MTPFFSNLPGIRSLRILTEYLATSTGSNPKVARSDVSVLLHQFPHPTLFLVFRLKPMVQRRFAFQIPDVHAVPFQVQPGVPWTLGVVSPSDELAEQIWLAWRASSLFRRVGGRSESGGMTSRGLLQ